MMFPDGAVHVKDAPIDMTGFTLPWMLYADEDGLVWINANAPIRARSGGTLDFPATRRREGVEVPANALPIEMPLCVKPPAIRLPILIGDEQARAKHNGEWKGYVE